MTVVTHQEDLGISIFRCFAVELERTTIEPAGPGLSVIVKAQPDVRELAGSRVGAPSQIDDMSDPERSQLFNVALSFHRAAKRQPRAYPRHFHALPVLLALQGLTALAVCKTTILQTLFAFH